MQSYHPAYTMVKILESFEGAMLFTIILFSLVSVPLEV